MFEASSAKKSKAPEANFMKLLKNQYPVRATKRNVDRCGLVPPSTKRRLYRVRTMRQRRYTENGWTRLLLRGSPIAYKITFAIGRDIRPRCCTSCEMDAA